MQSFQTQATSEDGSRPDLVGYDQTSAKRLIIESTFWATLLEDQPNVDFGQLMTEAPGVLMFVAPGARIETLRAKIRRQMETGPDGVKLEAVETVGQMVTRLTPSNCRSIIATRPRNGLRDDKSPCFTLAS